LLGKELPDWCGVNEKLQYKSENDEEFSLEIVPTEFMLGLADFTGEIMRFSINSLGCGNTENCFRVCRSLQEIYARFMTVAYVHNRSRDFSHKTATMRSSMLKCEEVCYNLKVRGTEGSKLVQLDALQLHRDDQVKKVVIFASFSFHFSNHKLNLASTEKAI
jgi:Translin family